MICYTLTILTSPHHYQWVLIAAGTGFIVKHKLSGLFATPSGEDIYAKAIVCSKLPAVWRFELDSSTKWNADAYR